MRHLIIPGFIAIASCSLSQQAFSQIVVTAQPVKREILNGEPASIRLTITNNTGRDITLQDAPDGSSWLDLSLQNSNDEDLPQIVFPKFGVLHLPANKSVGRSLTLDRFYDMSNDGQYKLNVVVHPPNERGSFISNTAFITIKTGVPMWSQTVGKPGSGEPIRYELTNANTRHNRSLYARGVDPRTGKPYFCIPLGEWLQITRPVARVDANNQFHVLFLHRPTLFVYFHISSDGKRSQPFFFERVEGVMPSFISDGKGGLTIQGANFIDPSTQKNKPDVDMNFRPD